MDFKLELIVVPVADVDRAKAFYVEQAGFGLDVDHRRRRLPGRPTHAPGLRMLDRTDAQRRRARFPAGHPPDRRRHRRRSCRTGRHGTTVSELFHFGETGQTDGPHPERADYGTFCSFADPDGNGWLVQEVGRAAS